VGSLVVWVQMALRWMLGLPYAVSDGSDGLLSELDGGGRQDSRALCLSVRLLCGAEQGT
jgi:hypothetical protein